MALVNIDTEKLANTIMDRFVKDVLPLVLPILKDAAPQLADRIKTNLVGRKLSIQIEIQ